MRFTGLRLRFIFGTVLRYAMIAILCMRVPLALAQTPNSADSYFDAANPVTPIVTKVPSASLSATPTNNKLYGFSLTAGANPGYIMVFNATSVPADGPVTPLNCYAVAAKSSGSVNYGNTPVYAPGGVVIVFSTGADCWTKVGSAAAFISMQVF